MGSDEKQKGAEDSPFGYMEELSKAYQEAFTERLARQKFPLPEEKKGLIGRMQEEISRTAGRIAIGFREETKKELARMVKESAEETLRAIEYDEEPDFTTDPTERSTLSELLSRAVLLANRSLNLLVRHTRPNEKAAFLILSELSASYSVD